MSAIMLKPAYNDETTDSEDCMLFLNEDLFLACRHTHRVDLSHHMFQQHKSFRWIACMNELRIVLEWPQNIRDIF